MESTDWLENVSEKKQKADFSGIEQLTTEAVAKHREDRKEEAIANFDLALAKSKQLPEFVLETLERERSSAQEKIVEIKSGKKS